MKTPASGAEFAGTIKTVLIVDDDTAIVRPLSILLSRAGFRPIVCRNGEEAMERAVPEVAAALVDIHLPDINGLELSQQLRARLDEDAPIFILSGDHSMDTIRQLPDAGATYFFAKPVNAEVLIARLKEWTAG